jgi:hypothetical protein
MSSNEATFNINVTAASGENYAGSFTIRKRLSHMQNLRRDELRRELLGKMPDQAPMEFRENAYILSTCVAYVIKAPRWWTENNNGLELVDIEPIAEVFREIDKVVSQTENELAQKDAKATEVLKQQVE